MSKKYEVKYHRASQVKTYKDPALVPIHSTTVEATSIRKARSIAAEVEGRIVISAKLIEDDATRDTTENNDVFTRFLDNAGGPSENEPPSLNEINRAAEELLHGNKTEVASATEAEESQERELFGEEEDIDDLEEDIGDLEEDIDDEPNPEPTPKPEIELITHNVTMSADVARVALDSAIRDIESAAVLGLATIEPLTVHQRISVDRGNSLLSDSIDAKRRVSYGEGYLKGYDLGKEAGYDEGYKEGYDEGYKEGYDEGYKEGYEEGTDEETVGTLGYALRLLPVIIAFFSSLVFSFAQDQHTVAVAFSVLLVSLTLALLVHFSARYS